MPRQPGLDAPGVLHQDHFHLLVRTGREPISKSMKKLLTGYVVNFNLRHKRYGHLFQNRYKSIICEEDLRLLELTRYIHFNPMRMGYPGAEVARYLGVTTSSVNRLATSEEVADLEKFLKML